MPKKEMIYPKGRDNDRRTFAPAVKAGGFIFLSGLGGSGEDIVAQTRQAYERMKECLEAAGASMADVVQTTDYITTTERYKETADIRREFFGDSLPASTGVIVAGLLLPHMLIEIAVVAVVGD